MHEVLATGVARDAFEISRVHERVAVNAHEARCELFLQRLQRVFDEVFALLVFDRRVLLIGLEAVDVFDRNQFESVAPANADMRALRRDVGGDSHLLELRTRQAFGLCQRGAQFLRTYRLQQVGHGFRIERLECVFVEGGGEDHRRRRDQGREMSGHFETIDAGHANVQQHDVRRQPVDHVDGLLSVARLARDLEFAGLHDQRAKALARRRLVVDDEYAQAHAPGTEGVNGNRSVTMYSSSKRPAFTVARSPYMRSSRSLMFASARRFPSRIVRLAAGRGLRTTMVTMPLLNSPVTVTTPPSARGSMPW